jgi:hypothetical protein
MRIRTTLIGIILAELESFHIRRYIHSFADEMGEDLNNIIKVFRFFNKYGM